MLYNIDENDVIETLGTYLSNREMATGKHEVVNKNLSKKYQHPLKVAFSVENDKIIVVTAYPLKKKRRK